MTNKLIILIWSLFVLHAVLSMYTGSDAYNWKLFKEKYSKSYANKAEEASRMKTFLAQLKDIKQHNKLYDEGKVSYKKAIHEYSDIPFEEFIQERGLNVGPSYKSSIIYLSNENLHNSSTATAPNSIDWRKHGAVTRVKRQARCGSCWAFSSTGALEGQVYRKTGRLIELSEQNLVDCTKEYGNRGCHGGWMETAFEYVKQNDGISTEKGYPYTGDDSHGCQYKKSFRVTGCRGYKKIRLGNERDLMNAVGTVGPVSITMELSSSFAMYSEGIWKDISCSISKGFHAMLIVGYGTSSKGEDYWLVKNSWGSWWGDKGYVKVARTGTNLCGIADHAIYPIV